MSIPSTSSNNTLQQEWAQLLSAQQQYLETVDRSMGNVGNADYDPNSNQSTYSSQ